MLHPNLDLDSASAAYRMSPKLVGDILELCKAHNMSPDVIPEVQKMLQGFGPDTYASEFTEDSIESDESEKIGLLDGLRSRLSILFPRFSRAV